MTLEMHTNSICDHYIFILSQLWLTSHPRSTVVLCDVVITNGFFKSYIDFFAHELIFAFLADTVKILEVCCIKYWTNAEH